MEDSALLLARAALDRGNGSRALEHLSSADNDDAEVWLMRTHATLIDETYETAEQYARSGLSVDPESVGLLCALGHALQGQRRYVDAEHAFVGALNRAPESLAALRAYAWLLAEAGDLSAARSVTQKMPAAHLGASPDGQALLGYIALVEGDSKQAQIHLDRGLSLDPGDVQLHSLKVLQLSLQNSGNENVTKHMTIAATLDPERAGGLGRDARYLNHPLMRPLHLIDRVGPAQLWLGWIASLWLIPRIWPAAPMGWIVAVYLCLAVYSWTVPFLLRKRMENRGQL